MKEFIELAKSGSLNYGTAGVGVTPHLSAELLFKRVAKVDVTHVPYNGGAPALAAVVAGHIQAASLAMPPAVPMVQSGQVRALAVTGAKRVAVLPEVPTVAESGYPEIEDYTWIAYFLPAGTPAAIVERFNAEVGVAMRQPDVVERLARAGFEPVGGSPAETARYIASEVRKWAKVVKDVGVTIE
jgi:tripartite-type tricarboxylate transporter receptor subunit TctC